MHPLGAHLHRIGTRALARAFARSLVGPTRIGAAAAALVLAGALLRPGVTLAGPNSGGMLLLHSPRDVAYTSDRSDWMGYSNLRRCEQANTQVPADGKPALVYVIAAFPSWASPRLSAIAFGIEYPRGTVYISDRGTDAFELGYGQWPEPGSGVGLSWGDTNARTSRVVESYWFAAYAYSPGKLELKPHPFQGGAFGDDSTPIELDTIDDYGILGFGEAGYNPCTAFLPHGACCDPAGNCTSLDKETCRSFGGEYLGDGTECSPTACLGPCCFGEECRALTKEDCWSEGGEFRGRGRECGRVACVPTRGSWGKVKSVFRD